MKNYEINYLENFKCQNQNKIKVICIFFLLSVLFFSPFILNGETKVILFSDQHSQSPNTTSINQTNKFSSATKYRGVNCQSQFKQKNFIDLKNDYGANLVRWSLTMNKAQIAEVGSDLTKYDAWLNDRLNELDSVLFISSQLGIKVVIDLFALPVGPRDSLGRAVFYNRQYNDHFVKVWQVIAQRYKGNPTVWGYDLINEPVQKKTPDGSMDFIQTQIRASKVIWKIDQKTPIIFEVDNWDSPDRFISLKPVPISNVIYEVHMYQTSLYTHQGVYNKATNIVYPGMIGGKLYNKNTLRKILQPVRNFQLKYHVPVYVGEFSAVRWAPGAAHYINDCIDIFEEYGWNWTYCAYRVSNFWDVEYENGTLRTEKAKKAIQDTDRKKVLLKWFSKNKKE